MTKTAEQNRYLACLVLREKLVHSLLSCSGRYSSHRLLLTVNLSWRCYVNCDVSTLHTKDIQNKDNEPNNGADASKSNNNNHEDNNKKYNPNDNQIHSD